MITILSLAGVSLIAIYLIGFAVLVAVKPDAAAGFMRLFACSAKAHFTELLCRTGAGVALIGAAPKLALGPGFKAFGWVLITTSLILAILPWRWHQSFAHTVVPVVLRYLNLYAASSMLLGLLVVAGIVIGNG